MRVFSLLLHDKESHLEQSPLYYPEANMNTMSGVGGPAVRVNHKDRALMSTSNNIASEAVPSSHGRRVLSRKSVLIKYGFAIGLSLICFRMSWVYLLLQNSILWRDSEETIR